VWWSSELLGAEGEEQMDPQGGESKVLGKKKGGAVTRRLDWTPNQGLWGAADREWNAQPPVKKKKRQNE